MGIAAGLVGREYYYEDVQSELLFSNENRETGLRT
jgi:hypothetical protein